MNKFLVRSFALGTVPVLPVYVACDLPLSVGDFSFGSRCLCNWK